jgi:hypothetical protein
MRDRLRWTRWPVQWRVTWVFTSGGKSTAETRAFPSKAEAEAFVEVVTKLGATNIVMRWESAP